MSAKEAPDISDVFTHWNKMAIRKQGRVHILPHEAGDPNGR